MTTTESDAALLAAAPAMLEAIRDVAWMEGQQREGLYDLASLAVRINKRLIQMYDDMDKATASQGLPHVDILLPACQLAGGATTQF